MKTRKPLKRTGRLVRETRMFARAMQSDSHPILAQMVPTRRCNLDCAYCMRSEIGNADPGAGAVDDFEEAARRHALSDNASAFIHTTKD